MGIRKRSHKISIDELLSLGIAGFLLVYGSFGVYRILQQRASSGIATDKVIQIRALLISDPMPTLNGNWVAEGRLRETQSENLVAAARGKVVIFGSDFPEGVGAGAFMQMRGKLEAQRDSIDEASYGSPFIFFSKSFHVVGWKTRYHNFRHRLNSTLIERLSGANPDASSLVIALLLGRNTDPGSPVMRSFRNSGCIHLLALSGFHLGMIAIAIRLIGKPLIGFSASATISAIGAVVFLILVGIRPSLFRAVIMYLLWTRDSLRGYKANILAYLSAAFIIQVVVFPQSTATLSFQLSYLAFCGLAISGRAYANLMSRYFPSKLSAAISASLGAQFFTLPTVIAIFGIWRPIGILAAPPLTLLTAIAMLFGSLRLVFASSSIPADIIDTALNHLVALIGKISFPFARFPAIELNSPLAWLIATVGAIIPVVLVRSINRGSPQAIEPRLPRLDPRLSGQAEACTSEKLGSELPY